MSSSDDSSTAHAIAVPAPRGKELRIPQEVAEAIPVLRGKELRIPHNDSDDEPLLRRGSKSSTVKKGTPKKASRKKRKDPPPPEESDDDAVTAAVVEDVPVAKKKSPSKKKRHKSTATAVPIEEALHSLAAPESIRSARLARDTLRSTIAKLPHKMNECYTIRCMGRITPDISKAHPNDSYSKADALYPVGFSCDRWEYSPVHGRVIKIRCEILDGSIIIPRDGLLLQNGHDGKSHATDELGNYRGPVFRVMWGQGIEADDDGHVSFPFCVDDTAVSRTYQQPTVGTRVSVKFDGGDCHEGKLTKVVVNTGKSTQYNTVWNVSILYDDGVTENTSYPDPDISLFPPGLPPIHPTEGWVDELHGKPVRCILAKTPLEAWGRTLLSLGLIDEIIYEEAMDTVEASREEALSEARDRVESIGKRKKDEKRAKHGHDTRHSTDSAKSEEEDDANMAESKVEDNENVEMKDQSEPPSEQEMKLLEKLDRLKKELADAHQESRSLSVDLARARISTISPFAANPFLCGADALSQDQSLMAAAVKKEKSRMGNTGNRRKVVTPATMLDRSDTFFTQDVERLIEGLTNSEIAPLYIFHNNRTSFISNQGWAYEAKIRHEKAIQKKLEKERAAADVAEAKALIESEKAMKRKAKDETTAAKMRQRDQEEDQKKKERVEKRLTQLSVQMDERLAKESFFANEKALTSYVKALNKEFSRRRKVADAVIAHKIDQLPSSSLEKKSTAIPTYTEKLPSLSNRLYDEAVVRIWDFLHCFSDAFVSENSKGGLPSIDALQDAFDELKKGNEESKSYRAAIGLMECIAVTLCKAISPGLTKHLAAAAYITDPSNKVSADPAAYLPVTPSTWREIARMSFIVDILIDLGYNKVESGNIVRGYRSGGHPNSKEAKRWKKIEDSPVVMLYQLLNDESNEYRRRVVTSRISAPSKPSCTSSEWRFFLHNIRSRSPNSVTYMKSNLEKSIDALKKSPQEANTQTYIAELERCLSILEQTPSGHSADPDLLKAKKIALDVLDSTRGKYVAPKPSKRAAGDQSKEPPRSKMGLLKNYKMSSEQYRKMELAKEDYMVNALKLKEELESKNKEDAAVLSDDEDDEEEGEDPADKPETVSKPDFEISNDHNRSTAEKAETYVEKSSSYETLHEYASSQGKTAAAVEANSSVVQPEAADSSSKAASIQPSELVNEDFAMTNDDNADTKTQPDTSKTASTPSADSKSDADTERSSPKSGSNGETSTGQDMCGMPSDYDFCADVPTAPDAIRRCLAVVRTLCSSGSSDPFIYPVDPQLYPGYYEAVMSPVSLYDVGNFLQNAAEEFSTSDDLSKVEHVVAEFGRNTRKIFQNSLAYNTGNKEHLTMNSAEEMLRLFERLFFDWVLAPCKPALKDLDDDKCVDSHDDDILSMVILCDACEGKYNMQRLKPPLKNVPAGEWYCPRCIQGRCWATEDPRIGRQVQSSTFTGTVESCKFIISEQGQYSLVYSVSDGLGSKQFWDLKDVDTSIVGNPVAPVSFLDALAESPGYSFGRDADILGNTLPLVLDPTVDDKAANSALSSNVYQDTVASCIALTHASEDLNCSEWVRLLMLLVAKCSSSDTVLELASHLENKEATALASAITTFWRARAAKNIVPDIYSDDESDGDEDSPEEVKSELSKSNDDMDVDTNASTFNKSTPGKELRIQDSNESSNDGAKPNNEEAPDKPTISPEEEIRRKNRESALFSKTTRQTKRQEALVGHYVQNSMKSTVASFEEDPLSSLVNSTVCNQEEGLNYSSVRCREICHFCHLGEMAICSPMCRVPNDAEWNEIFPHAIHDRNSYMVAQLPAMPSSHAPNDYEEKQVKKPEKACIVRVRVGGELVTEKTKTLDYPSKILDQPLTQYLPRNPLGFQSELSFRKESNLSVVTGSLTAHEVCAIAAHRTRKEIFLKDRREYCKATLARDAAISCGKSIPIGQDQCGRSYWLFKAEPKTLFICDSSAKCTNENNTAKWHRFSTPEAIASVIVGLHRDSPSESLKEAYPDAASLLKDRLWSTLLMEKALKPSRKTGSVLQVTTSDKPKDDAKLETPFVEDEDVFVESENGKFLWDAVVVDVSKDSNGQVDGYFVHFKGWSSRYDCWASRDRVVPAHNENKEIQKEVLEDIEMKQAKAPAALAEMFALQSLQQSNWKTSKYFSNADLHEYTTPRSGASYDEQSLLLLKGSILLIEAALPAGAIEYWPAHAALLWSKFVKHAKGPESLLKCVLLLEDAISPEYMKPQATQLLSALPRQWRAMGEASVSSVALRVAVLDQSLKYSR